MRKLSLSLRVPSWYIRPLCQEIRYYEMSYGLNIEMHKQATARVFTVTLYRRRTRRNGFLPPRPA
ncbi:hypothetical protein EYF80_030125 [Liparis tanakae]|uniref:Uncharacterized protein n=1 Tax=Liparis tanakae TaxID=230148 RepID=A0A4Z2H1J0_9TELE|nr:hypothetical protein EYF80_030125 [Liparis tanakae]